jgi:hypothetical protein
MSIFYLIIIKKQVYKMLASKEQIKVLLLMEKMTIKELADEMTRTTGKKYSRQSISSKLYKGTLRYDEVKAIAEILGYEIEFKKV